MICLDCLSWIVEVVTITTNNKYIDVTQYLGDFKFDISVHVQYAFVSLHLIPIADYTCWDDFKGV